MDTGVEVIIGVAVTTGVSEGGGVTSVPVHTPWLHTSPEVLLFPSSQLTPSVFLAQEVVLETAQLPTPSQTFIVRLPICEQVLAG